MSSSQQVQILKQFDLQLTAFFDELIQQFPTEGDLIIIRLFLTNQINAEDKIKIFHNTMNNNNNAFRNAIKSRNYTFFLNNDLFDQFNREGGNESGHFKKIWASGVLDNDDKEVIFKWLDTFVTLSDKYFS